MLLLKVQHKTVVLRQWGKHEVDVSPQGFWNEGTHWEGDASCCVRAGANLRHHHKRAQQRAEGRLATLKHIALESLSGHLESWRQRAKTEINKNITCFKTPYALRHIPRCV